jgi:hypothetical protein
LKKLLLLSILVICRVLESLLNQDNNWNWNLTILSWTNYQFFKTGYEVCL